MGETLAEERADGHKDVNAGMTASLHTPTCPGVYHLVLQYSEFQTWLQKFLTLFEREDSSPFLNLDGLVLQGK